MSEAKEGSRHVGSVVLGFDRVGGGWSDGRAAGDGVHGSCEAVAALGGSEAVRGVDHRGDVVDDDFVGVEHAVAKSEMNANVSRSGRKVALAQGCDDAFVVAPDARGREAEPEAESGEMARGSKFS